MSKTTTIKELTEFYQNEKKWLESVGLVKETTMPKDSTIKAILQYSKVLSIRKTKNFGVIETILN